MNPFEMVVIIVAITAVASIARLKYGVRRDKHGNEHFADNKENDRLRDEVKALKERLAVIERITIEKENSLEREIEQLRDR
ncbi:MAG: hypothetical protein H0W74_02110 [Sphingosinicella sp.]|nr:hypothetical protein [Sphingosinicella sp.]